MTLRKKLLLLLLVSAAVPATVAGALAYAAAERALSQEIQLSQTRAAAAEAEYASQYLAAITSELSASVFYEKTASLRPAGEQDFLTRVFLRRNRISIASLLDPSKGRVAASIFMDDPRAFGRLEPQFLLHDTVAAPEAEDFQQRALALLARTSAPGPLVSAPYLSRARHRPSVAVVVPAPPGQPLSLAAEVALDELLRRTEFYDAEGHAVGAQGGPTLPALAGMPGSGTLEYERDGRTYLAAYAPVPALGWTAVIARPRKVAFRPLAALTRSTAAVLLVTLCAVAVLAAFAARRLSGPIARLTEGARAMAQGDYAARVGVGGSDELGQLARSFNSMGRHVQEANERLTRFNEELQKEVELRTRELKLAQEQLLRSQRLAAVGDLAAGFAHEINNPLAAIIGNAQLLQLQTETPRALRDQCLADIAEEGLRIATIVRELLALSEARPEGTRLVELRGVVERSVSALSNELRGAPIAVEKDFDPQPAVVLGDETALVEVFGRLLSNSAGALGGKEQGTIKLATRLIDNQAVCVEISDNGCGIPRELLDRVFNPFFTTKRQARGRGLSLSICHRIVESHGGKIAISSEENAGTTVTVVLPVAPAAASLR